MFNMKEYLKQWRQEHKEYCREYRQIYREKLLKYAKEYRQDHKEKLLEYGKGYRLEHRGERLEYQKQWRERNPEYLPKYLLEYLKKYSKTEAGKATIQRMHIRRRAKMKEIANTLTAEEWMNILEQHNFRCAYCGKNLLNLFDRATRDHIIPISRGGNNTKDNVIPACRSCNSKKSNRI